MSRESIKSKASGLTQRLDHMVPDPEMPHSANQKAAAELASLSSKLFWHVPDKSLSTMERLERLGRAVDDVEPLMSQLQPATKKLVELKKRIDQLVPGDGTHEQKLDKLLQQLDAKVGTNQVHLHTTDKLELLGDPRAKIAPEVKSVAKPKKGKKDK